MSARRIDALPSALDVETALARFATYLVAKHASPNTVDAYSRDLAAFLAHLREHAPSAAADAREITIDHVEAWIYARAFSHKPSSVVRARYSMRAWLRWMLRTKTIEHDLAERIRMPARVAPEVRVLTVGEVAKLVEAPTTVTGREVYRNGRELFTRFTRVRDRAVLELLYGSGLRVSEVVGLNIGDLDFDRREALVLGKGRRERMVPLGRVSIAAIQRWLRVRGDVAHRPAFDAEALFVSRFGARLQVRNVQRFVKMWAQESTGDPNVHPHLLRHACATHMLNGGAGHKAIQEMLGHASAKTTTEYTHVSPEFIDESYHRAHPLGAKRKETKR